METALGPPRFGDARDHGHSGIDQPVRAITLLHGVGPASLEACGTAAEG